MLSLQPVKAVASTESDARSDAQAPLTGSIGDYLPVQLQLLDNSDDRRLFRYIQRYHYLGYKVLYGAQLRYFVRFATALPPCWPACCSPAPPGKWRGVMSTSAGRSPPGQPAIGSQYQPLSDSAWCEFNPPAISSRWRRWQLPGDWLAAYRAQPVLLETLVDATRYHGGCYRAANWTECSVSRKAAGGMDQNGGASVRKHIFLFPLHRHWRARLCDPARSLVRSADEPAGNLR